MDFQFIVFLIFAGILKSLNPYGMLGHWWLHIGDRHRVVFIFFVLAYVVAPISSVRQDILSPGSGTHLPPLHRLARWLLADTFECKKHDVFYRELVRVKMRRYIFKQGNLLHFPRQILACVVHQCPMPCLFRAGMMTIHHWLSRLSCLIVILLSAM